MKVRYWDVGRETTAYLDDDPLPDGSYIGVNKYTDLPVRLTWNADAEQWIQVSDLARPS